MKAPGPPVKRGSSGRLEYQHRAHGILRTDDGGRAVVDAADPHQSRRILNQARVSHLKADGGEPRAATGVGRSDAEAPNESIGGKNLDRPARCLNGKAARSTGWLEYQHGAQHIVLRRGKRPIGEAQSGQPCAA